MSKLSVLFVLLLPSVLLAGQLMAGSPPPKATSKAAVLAEDKDAVFTVVSINASAKSMVLKNAKGEETRVHMVGETSVKLHDATIDFGSWAKTTTSESVKGSIISIDGEWSSETTTDRITLKRGTITLEGETHQRPCSRKSGCECTKNKCKPACDCVRKS